MIDSYVYIASIDTALKPFLSYIYTSTDSNIVALREVRLARVDVLEVHKTRVRSARVRERERERERERVTR